MVIGIGADIVEIKRITVMVEKYGDQFLRKVFTDREILYCNAKAAPSIHFAGRWAAKEAFYKALPGCCQPMSGWKSMEVLAGERDAGKPRLSLCDEKLGAALKENGVNSMMASISHEKTMCVAFVILTD
jgi:holo-[acyl-carrier protein] synthase